MAGLIPGVQLGKRYKISMSPAPHHLVSFQYRFKPPVDEGVDAKVNVDLPTGRWGVTFRAGFSRNGVRATHTYECFEGNRTQSVGESLLVWQPHGKDGEGEFIVEPIATPVHLHHVTLDSTDTMKTNVAPKIGNNHSGTRTTEARFQQLIKGKKRPVGRPRKAGPSAASAAASTSTAITRTHASDGLKSASKVCKADFKVTFTDDEDLFGDNSSNTNNALDSEGINGEAASMAEVTRERRV